MLLPSTWLFSCSLTKLQFIIRIYFAALMDGWVKYRKRSPNSLCLRLFPFSIPSSSTQVVIQAEVCEDLHQREWVIKSYRSITICTMKHIRTPDMAQSCCEWNKVSHSEKGDCHLLPLSDASFYAYTNTRKMTHSVPFNSAYMFLQKKSCVTYSWVNWWA